MTKKANTRRQAALECGIAGLLPHRWPGAAVLHPLLPNAALHAKNVLESNNCLDVN